MTELNDVSVYLADLTKRAKEYGQKFEKVLEDVLVQEIWRTGRKLHRTLYIQRGPEPSDADTFVGIMDTPELANLVCEAMNRRDAS